MPFRRNGKLVAACKATNLKRTPGAVTVAGYSGTPLARKLGIKAGGRVFVVRAPENYRSLVAPLPDRATIARKLSSDVHIIHLFSTMRKQLESAKP